jgi:UPF0755 protein
MSRKLTVLALIVLLLLGAAVIAVARYASTPLGFQPSPVRVTVSPGMSLRAIGQELARQRVLSFPLAFVMLARVRGHGSKLQAGVYEFTSDMSPEVLIERMVRGDTVKSEVRFIEGWTFSQVRAQLDAHADIRHETRGLSDRDVLERIGAIERSAEGLFFPDTYYFNLGTSDVAILRLAYGRMRERLRVHWDRRAAGSPLASPYELLILASIVEKETGHPEDRGMIAAVFTNRLRLGMRLQSDPTVIYGMGSLFDGNLRRKDLESDTPYNTYTRSGLPPTPIALPGEDAIAAAASPPASKALYFVSRGDGSSEFSTSLADHNRAVDRYQRR